jgi:hypothetical protein
LSPGSSVYLLIVALYAALGLIVLAPEAVYSGDIGVKYVQARALAQHRFGSLDIPYPGEVLDAEREFSPLREPFVMTTGGGTQAIFPPAGAVLYALPAAIGGIRGLVAVSLVAAAIILYSAWRLVPSPLAAPLLLTLGIASPLWFYAVSGWEHAPAMAFGTAAFGIALASRVGAAPVVAGRAISAARSASPISTARCRNWASRSP